jgi:LysM repeat protein
MTFIVSAGRALSGAGVALSLLFAVLGFHPARAQLALPTPTPNSATLPAFTLAPSATATVTAGAPAVPSLVLRGIDGAALFTLTLAPPSPAPTAEITSAIPVTVAEVLNALLQTTVTVPGEAPAPVIYTVVAGDTLFLIAQSLDVDMTAWAAANQLTDVNVIEVGQQLVVPPAGERPAALVTLPTTAPPPAGDLLGRMAPLARTRLVGSPYEGVTWLTYYGRPGIPVMGIIGEHEIPTLTQLLLAEAAVYDEANGPDLAVRPAYHLVYGMATVEPQADGSYLNYLPDETTMAYIAAGLATGIEVILDIQVGALSAADSISRALPFLEYPNVHLAVDPEFAMVHPGQQTPGNPIGYLTGAMVNEVQQRMTDYLRVNALPGRRVLLIHQFQENMIIGKEEMDWTVPEVGLTLVADGWGDPWGKISKYNSFFSDKTGVGFTAFKLFYQWDEPVLTERQTLGVDPYSAELRMEVTPNLVIYQ